MRRLLLPLLLLVSLVGCDQATKEAAQAELRASEPITLVTDVFELRYTENRDVGFSLLRSIESDETRRALILALGLVILGVIAVVALRRRREATAAELVAFAMLGAGAVGNLLDRLFRGYVIDFLHLSHWPIFNVADVLLVVGVLLLLLTSRSRAGPVDRATVRPVDGRSPTRV